MSVTPDNIPARPVEVPSWAEYVERLSTFTSLPAARRGVSGGRLARGVVLASNDVRDRTLSGVARRSIVGSLASLQFRRPSLPPAARLR
jgi:hypothetical protein